MNNKVAVLTVAFNEPTLIGPCVRQFKNPMNPLFHAVLISDTPWRGDVPYDDGETFLAAYSNADFIQVDNWKNQAEQFNWGLKELKDLGFEWAIICDADEFYTYHDIEELLKDISFCDKEGMNAVVAQNMDVYWKLPIFKIIPTQTDSPIIAIKTDQIFTDKRNSEATPKCSGRPIMHHFSYVRSNSEMKKKISSFEHSHEFNLEEWYKNKWLTWGINTEDLHPVVPEQFKRAIYNPAPQEIINNIYFSDDNPYKKST